MLNKNFKSEATVSALWEELRNRENVKDHGKERLFSIEQRHGDCMMVPPGFGHIVINKQPNVKFAMDIGPKNGMHLCCLNYLQLWREFKGNKAEFYIDYIQVALEKLKLDS